MHAAESVAGGAGRERAMAKATADRYAEAAMVHPVEVDDALAVVEMVQMIDTGNRDYRCRGWRRAWRVARR